MRQTRSPLAFTLTELLVSLGVMAVLVALGVISMGQIRRYSDLAVCTANLKQAGAAVLAYSAEHRGMMPGPASGGVRTNASEWGMREKNLSNLADYLAPYFGVSNLETGAVVQLPVLTCHAAARAIAKDYPNYTGGMQHYIHLATWIEPGLKERGFGFKDSKKVHLYPLRITQFRDLSKSIALMDRDNELLGLFGDIGADRPDKSAHGRVRNVLFFDGRVEAIDVERFKAVEAAVQLN